MRETKVEKWKRQYTQKAGLEKIDSFDELMALLVDGDHHKAERAINPTQKEYILSTERFKAYMGAAGVAKTTTGVTDIILRALLLPGSKWFIARRDYNDLKDTTLRTFTRVLQRLPEGTVLDRSKEPPMKVVLRPIQLAGVQVALPSEITFMGLSDDVGSYEFNGGFIDEADEVERTFVEQLKGRMRYKPYPEYPEETGYMMGLAFNPPDKNHWLYLACTGKDGQDEEVPGSPPWLTMFKPQPKENERNLPKGYHAAMAATMPEDLRQRLVDGEWGSVFPGAPVIPQFKSRIHVDPDIKYGRGTLFRFWDFGYNRPYTVIANVTKQGHIQCIAEYLGFKEEVLPFVSNVQKLCAEFAHEPRAVADYGDPAVKQHKDTGSALAMLNGAGILMMYQKVPFDISLRLMRARFEQLIDGKPAISIHPRCRVLIGALSGGYHFKEDGVTPKKDGYYDHPVDALRYGVYNLFGASLTSANVDHLPTNVAYWSH